MYLLVLAAGISPLRADDANNRKLIDENNPQPVEREQHHAEERNEWMFVHNAGATGRMAGCGATRECMVDAIQD